MNLWKVKTLLLAWLLSMMSNHVDDGSGQDSVISCKTKGAPAGETASLTCYFPFDVQQAQQNLFVEKLNSGQTEDPPETVSYCDWSEGAPQCTNKDGITCEIANDHVELKFIKATQDCEGLYKCDLLPPDDTPVHPCWLKLADTPSTEQPSEYTTTTEETYKTTSTENHEPLIIGLIAGLVVQSIILLVVIPALIVLVYKRNHCVDCQSRQRRGHSEEFPREWNRCHCPREGLDERDSPIRWNH